MVDEARRTRLVAPYYLKMMRINAVGCGPGMLASVTKDARAATVDDVVALLREPWRETVMGAWMALLHDGPKVRRAVLQALGASLGSLDSPPLVTVAVVLLGADALQAVAEYAVRDLENGWGACGFASAATEYLGGTSGACEPTDRDRIDFAHLLAVAEQLQAAR